MHQVFLGIYLRIEVVIPFATSSELPGYLCCVFFSLLNYLAEYNSRKRKTLKSRLATVWFWSLGNGACFLLLIWWRVTSTMPVMVVGGRALTSVWSIFAYVWGAIVVFRTLFVFMDQVVDWAAHELVHRSGGSHYPHGDRDERGQR